MKLFGSPIASRLICESATTEIQNIHRVKLGYKKVENDLLKILNRVCNFIT